MEEEAKLKVFPVQFVELPDGVLLVRGSTRFRVQGTGAATAVKMVLAGSAAGTRNAGEVMDLFEGPARAEVKNLIRDLLTRRILYPEGEEFGQPQDREENEEDIFYWNFGQSLGEIRKRLNNNTIVFVGVNRVSARMISGLVESGLINYQVIDYDLLRNVRMFDSQGRLKEDQWPSELNRPVGDESWLESLDLEDVGCLVAVADYPAQAILRDWNRYCVDNGIIFLPVTLTRAVGLVGPLYVPGETACYECLRARENANLDFPELARAGEEVAFGGQMVNGFHPLMASALGDYAAMELVKFLSFSLPWRVGELIEVNLLEPDLRARKVLRLPRCPVCGPLEMRPAHTALKSAFERAKVYQELNHDH